MRFISLWNFLPQAVIVFLYFILLHRVLDRLRLSPKTALILLMLMLGGTFLPEIPLGSGLALNIGGMLIPLGIALYLISTASQNVERKRTLLTAVAVAAAMWGLNRLLPRDPGYLGFDIDPLFMPSLAAGTIAYILGRSRRAAFGGAVIGVLFLELAFWMENLIMELPQAVVTLGDGGVFGAAVISSALALLLAEVVGEIRERLKRGEKRV